MNTTEQEIATKKHPPIEIDGEVAIEFSLDKHRIYKKDGGKNFDYQHLTVSAYNNSNTSLVATLQINNVKRTDIENIIDVLNDIADEIE